MNLVITIGQKGVEDEVDDALDCYSLQAQERWQAQQMHQLRVSLRVLGAVMALLGLLLWMVGAIEVFVAIVVFMIVVVAPLALFMWIFNTC